MTGTKITKRKRGKESRALRNAKANAAAVRAQLVTVRPSPEMAAIGAAVFSWWRGDPVETIASNAIGAAVEQTDTRHCPQCGAFVLWKAADEMPPICKCGQDLATAPKATREHVAQAFANMNKPKH